MAETMDPEIGEEMKEIPKSSPSRDTTTNNNQGWYSSQTTPVIDKTLSSVANLAQLLPTGTVLAFQALSSSFTNHGTCHTSNKYLSLVLIVSCSLSCIFFSFTDSFIGSNNKHYYGVATLKGLYVFNDDSITDEEKKQRFGDLNKYKIRFLDYVHAFFSVLLFLTVSLGDASIQECFFNNGGVNVKELLVNLPLGAGVLSSLVFMVFPTTRKGIGYSG
ncbi:hypothetical protein QJS04_geneDACA014396 [Acorus gramineus]|uniref:Uncharacterized protein n=1 Tax=Acorus gramineus TaxID=55184 RepID=A0AAV8ZYZ7_ACOGR|nr:hypothetical protein QJS04_geneDACA014396 [Acorus gramineus]